MLPSFKKILPTVPNNKERILLMDTMRAIRFLFFVCMIISIPFYALGDKIYLKNKRVMEGIIEKEDQERVRLNIGIGTITISKDEIEYIKKSSLNEQEILQRKWEKKYFTYPEFVPQRLKDINSEFNNLERVRDAAIKNKLAQKNIIKKIDELDKERAEVYEEYIRINKNLTKASPEKDIKEYNNLVSEHNSLSAQIRVCDHNREELMRQSSDLYSEISSYNSCLAKFRILVNSRIQELREDSSKQEEAFFRKIKEEIGRMEKDFTHHNIPIKKKEGAVMVDVVLNSSIYASFVVDTGATTVLLSNEVADRLRVKKDESFHFFAILANGEKVKAYPVVLESIKVGGVEVKNVPASVLEKSLPISGDGLLGMSFLNHFMVRIDGKTNTLILEKFNP